MMAELQKYQWTMSGMRPDDSQLGAMWFYRGIDVDAALAEEAPVMTADELRAELVERCRAIDADLQRRELIVSAVNMEHHAVIETLRRQYDAFAYLIPLIDDAMADRPVEEDDD
jgi:hypothetical protein